MKKLRVLILSLFTLTTLSANAQIDLPVQQLDSCEICKPYPWEIGALLGPNQYFGDMHCSQPYASQNNLMGGIFLRRHLNDFVALRPQVLIGKLAGRDLDQPDGLWDYRRLNFKSSPFVEAALLAEIYPFRERRFTCDGLLKNGLSPYIFGGIGAVYSNPKVYQEPGAEFPVIPSLLQADRDHLEKFGNRIGAVFPIGLGVKYNLANRWTIGIEGGYRFTTTDYLDGISLAGNPDRKDGYFLANVLASYRFGSKDSDGDGVPDYCDACPDVPGLPKFQGCPDSDGDGVPDHLDLCPDVPGSAALGGCPDRDGDGIPDHLDACPDVAGLASLNGCPDRDGDGFPDHEDQCPDVFGTVDGCPDSDGDGIPDHEDDCPYTFGLAELNGCPDYDADGVTDNIDNCLNIAGDASALGCPDADGDGVPDAIDKCPTIPGLASNDGCPHDYLDGVPMLTGFRAAEGLGVSRNEMNNLSFAAQGIEFYAGSSRLKPSSMAQLQKICDVLKNTNSGSLLIRTYNDGNPTAQNLRLANARAAAVYNYLVSKNCIDKSRMSYEGAGDEDLSTPYRNAAGNRSGSRTEFILD